MNVSNHNFEGTGMRESGDAESEAIADAVSEALSQPTAVEQGRGAIERTIAKLRTQKAAEQQSIAASRARVRRHTENIRGLEDALDRLAEAEA